MTKASTLHLFLLEYKLLKVRLKRSKKTKHINIQYFLKNKYSESELPQRRSALSEYFLLYI